MQWLRDSTRRYPLVAITLLVAAIAAAAGLAGSPAVSQWLCIGWGVIVAAMQAVGMIRDIMRGHWGLDILAVTAIVATILVGEYVATIIIVLMLTGGEALEDYAAGRARRELTALLERAPQLAHRLGDDGGIEDIAVSEVRAGDLLLLRPAELVPVDAQLLSPVAVVDQSSLTGESLPVELRAGDDLLSGSVNAETAVRIRATATAADSQYQRIVALVAEAAESKAPVVRLADRYAVPFTVVALLIAGIAWAASGDPVRFAEVLVVATPCPLLIAAPVAFMGGMSRAARGGIIVKGGGVLEQLAAARTIVFDKTGTLTTGTPTVEQVRPTGGFDADELLALAASAEQYSSHVLAASIMRAARERRLALRDASTASEHATSGVVAQIDGREVIVGKLAFVRARAPSAEPTELAAGELAIYLAIDGSFAGSIVARDSVRENAAETIAELEQLGVGDTMMLTGDAWPTARHVAAELGIEHVQAECLPADKVRAVRAVERRPVIMVGDGVNDAPVLASADVGVAMGAKGATAASESADVVITLDDISRTARAVRIGRDTRRIALQSIWIGIVISVGLMLVAAVGVIPATVGALSQEVVDLVAILWALRAIGTRRDRVADRGRATSRGPAVVVS
ncbi:heavy metal-(Cd/Co/Hg/Pb/Zn)-translocating P-type ATPase [Agrococcus baldri]|uniref:Heavy metal-(Cd/Co/Hg/Pb/Zn)-translocating P-type ATPase n=1 Tax=Agrococcus baldri TaxID=153730 RepID=A0AA94HMV8_9MICO|nr:heavy metal translocating P-type ATPase [Agrococcus baldri]SFS13732.1 heavy metal-(Cd/Co/Hg/Pb/Zn)-translocating P-type ATPase [Agrococcus baldri]